MRAAAIHLALAAMVFRVLVPSGWMPSPSQTRGIPIVMCTMDGPVKMVLPIDGKTNPVKKPHVCPFGAAPHFATAIPLLALGAPVRLAYRDVEPPRASADIGRPHTPQSPRAPPIAA
jgi:hypothetical protein